MALTLSWIPISTIWLSHLYIYIHISFLSDSCKKYLAFQISYKKLFLTDTVDWRTTSTWAEGGFQNCRKVAETLDTSFWSVSSTPSNYTSSVRGNKIKHPARESCNLTLWYLWGWQMCNVSQKKMILLWRKTMSIRLFCEDSSPFSKPGVF